MITLKVYLKNYRKCYEFTFDSRKKVDQFYDDLRNKSIVAIGPLTFSVYAFSHCIEC